MLNSSFKTCQLSKLRLRMKTLWYDKRVSSPPVKTVINTTDPVLNHMKDYSVLSKLQAII